MTRNSSERVKERQHAVDELTRRYRRMSETGALRKTVEMLSFQLKKQRRKALLRAHDMSAVLGVSSATIVRWENDPGRMTVEQLVTILHLLDMDTALLRVQRS